MDNPDAFMLTRFKLKLSMSTVFFREQSALKRLNLGLKCGMIFSFCSLSTDNVLIVWGL